ncbi:hypothetical protein DMN91_007050 [Ooceraea biroi]|uniref:NADH dehydrogenase [ubiquinone] 1 beta subcomplex subunit 9 n=1 Tax=Ooceraea biroi TaxID=2015173 RepID=A0A026W8A6_OOCBI|nr:NADH dehydrogenase [ubiquinone] 1 beta subcomplex subunit 9 [Ooceraea biroi]EZA52290.1 NADH dehydrogenase [ubiquinone] 1 beta subcomplex subunit [Ooceraea biroi]RLU20440.1 hypothetical protein DMN91_007050 [Ooceraea biroi]
MAKIPSELISHKQKVCSLYKRAVRGLWDYHHDIDKFRIEAVLMRERFDKNKNIKDLRQAKALLLEGEEEYFNRSHPVPFKFAKSIGGSAYGREAHIPDSVMDYWHPLEKACYPKYFARREQMKNEYIEWYFKTYPEEKEKQKISDQ